MMGDDIDDKTGWRRIVPQLRQRLEEEEQEEKEEEECVCMYIKFVDGNSIIILVKLRQHRCLAIHTVGYERTGLGRFG